MTKKRLPLLACGSPSIATGACVVLAIALSSLLIPQVSQAVDATPAPVGINVSVPVIEAPPAPTAGAIIPVGAAADTAQVEVVVAGLQPYSYFELYLYSTPKLVASGFADSTGTFKVTIILPTTLEVGNHSLGVKATDAGGQPYTKTISQFAITADRRLAGAGPGSSLISSTVNTAGSVASSTQTTQTTQTDPAAAVEALGSNPLDVGGILYAGGVVASTAPLVTPRGGTVILAMTVKNVSNTTFDVSLDFWLTSPLGDTLAYLDPISVAGLAPGETRTVQATLTNVGQWPVMTAHATLTPPAAVEGTDLSAVTRDTVVWMWPFFALIMFGLLVAGYALWRFLPIMGKGRRAERSQRRDDAETLADAAAIVRAEAHIVDAQASLDDDPLFVAEPERPHPLEPAASVVPKKPRAPRTPKGVPAADNDAVTKPVAKKPPAPRAPKVVSPASESREDDA
ncbi:hypothetical protein GCM10027022_02170 [Alpinimonas psychrophila]|uniref:Oxygen tolerance n=1 Tax=Alpinimonas psychrophila TaxID=748908 RepID=A0A7W3JRS8_9MICO|nr:hypothetical protein [Alpinimonas psychrophila]MBA8828025.1 hypothetical protein [Alpinimonas psychrophila]